MVANSYSLWVPPSCSAGLFWATVFSLLTGEHSLEAHSERCPREKRNIGRLESSCQALLPLLNLRMLVGLPYTLRGSSDHPSLR